MSIKQDFKQQFVQINEANEQVQDNEQNQLSDLYETPLMLDENDQFEIYQLSPKIHQQPTKQNQQQDTIRSQDKISSQQKNQQKSQQKNQKTSKIQYEFTPLENIIVPQCNSPQITNIKKQPQYPAQYPDTDLDQQTLELENLLKTKFGHFNQRILIQMLYDKCYPNQAKQSTSKSITKQSSNIKNIKEQTSLGMNSRNDFENVKKLHRSVKIFIQHGYGINIARKYASKGQIILPNPYNNLICKIIKQAWKNIETEVGKVKKPFKCLSADQFNSIKTSLANAKGWMQKQYLSIFHRIISNIHGLGAQKPSVKEFEAFYDYMKPKNKSKKRILQAKEIYKKGKSKQFIQRQDSGNEQFKPPKYQQKIIEMSKAIKKLVKR